MYVCMYVRLDTMIKHMDSPDVLPFQASMIGMTLDKMLINCICMLKAVIAPYGGLRTQCMRSSATSNHSAIVSFSLWKFFAAG